VAAVNVTSRDKLKKGM